MEYSVIIFILLIHFLADFGLQTHEQAKNKSSNNLYLFYHVAVYSGIWYIALLGHPHTENDGAFISLFVLITSILHFCTDYVTSRISKKFFEKQDYHNGFVVVGFDQLLHYIQLFSTWYILF